MTNIDNMLLEGFKQVGKQFIREVLNEPVKVKLETTDDTMAPYYAKPGDAGMDIRASRTTYIPTGSSVIVPTGIKVAIPVGYEIQVRPRSGVSAKTFLRVANSPGTIDSGYRGEIGVILHNTAPCHMNGCYDIKGKLIDDTADKVGYIVHKGDRIAQIVLNKVQQIQWETTDDVTLVLSDRGTGGFGSTGVE